MPNYEIYPGDIHAILDVLDQGRGPVRIDSTDFQAAKGKGSSKYDIMRDGKSVGHMFFDVTDQILYMGRLNVDEAYRKNGIGNLLVFIALMLGVRANATKAGLNDQIQANDTAPRFWANLGLSEGSYPALQHVLNKFEKTQSVLAEKLGLDRSPWTLLLNTDKPALSSSSSSSGTKSVVRRKLSL